MPTDRWNVGEPREFVLEFRDQSANLANPAAVTVTVLLPDRTLVNLSSTVTHPSVGRYLFTYTTEQAGEHIFRVASTGPVATVTETELYAVPVFEAAADNTHARADAARALSRMVAADAAPPLTDEDLQRLLDGAARPDGTWNLARAAAEGWRWKAGRVAGGFSFSADGVAVDKTMLMRHMLDMAKSFDEQASRAKGLTTVPLIVSDPIGSL